MTRWPHLPTIISLAGSREVMRLRPHRYAFAAVTAATLSLSAACGSNPSSRIAGNAAPTSTSATPATTVATPLPVVRVPTTAATSASTTTTKPSPPPCPSTLAGQLASTGKATQLITVDTSGYGSTTATVALWQRAAPGGCWTPAAGPWTGRVGHSGVSDHHREGDGTTPTGSYGIGAVMYGIAADPGVHYQYHPLVCGDWWDEDPSSPTYNTFQHVPCGTQPRFGGKSEALWQETTAYQHFAVVDYNSNPVVAGAGSAVFIHDDTGNPTDGCVSLPAADLDTLLRWLQPSHTPLITIGTDAEIRSF